MRALFALVISVTAAAAEGERAGDFDYYVLSLSWSPNWCELEGKARRSSQCTAGSGFGWVLHGLWPQYSTGWPSYCHSPFVDASRSQTAQMADIMGSSGSAWHQWKKHGRCSGLPAQAYFDMARQAYEAVNRPAVLRSLKDPITLPAEIIEAAFLRDNPVLQADMITVTCKQNHIQEARFCLSKDLRPQRCGADVLRDCRSSDAQFHPVK